jgi:DNA-binding NarL/FixJ family response regulator
VTDLADVATLAARRGAGTVRNRVSYILAKLEFKTRTEASGLARRQGRV